MICSKWISSIGLLMLAITGWCQDLTPAEKAQSLESISSGAYFQPIDERKVGTKGIPTISEEFVPGVIVLRNGRRTNSMINYDAFNDQLIVNKEGRQMTITDALVFGFVMGMPSGDSLRFVKCPDSSLGRKYIQVLEEGPLVTLYQRRSKMVVEPNYRGPYNAGRDYIEYKDNSRFFVCVDSKTLHECPNRKALARLLPGHSDEVLSYAREHQVNFKDETELRLLIRFLNGMQP